LAFLDKKFGPCNHRLDRIGPLECPNLAERLAYLAQLKMDGLAVIKARSGCKLSCKRVDHSNFLVHKQDAHIIFSGMTHFVPWITIMT